MTNKQKYPNAKIEKNAFTNHYGRYYIPLGDGRYLKRNGEAQLHCCKYPELTYFESEQSAQAALNKFMAPDPTLSEIKSQLAEAKKLIGKKFTNTHDSFKNICDEVVLFLVQSGKTSHLVNSEIAKNGFCIAIKVSDYGKSSYPFSICKEDKSVQLSSQYTAELVSGCWKIGSKEFSVSFIREIYNFLSSHSASKVTAYDVTFDLDMVKKLCES